jgi:hypothetical protein
MADDDLRCPKCGSRHIHAEKRGWNIWTGVIRSGQIVITCLKCAHRFRPGEGRTNDSDAEDTSLPRYLVAGRNSQGTEMSVIVHATDNPTAFALASRQGLAQATRIERLP